MTPERNLLAMMKPPKPISQMSEKELDAFVQQLSDKVASASPKPAA